MIKNLIIGLGNTGLSVARYFSRSGQPFEICDTRNQPPGLSAFKKEFPFHVPHLGPLIPELTLDAENIIVSPGVNLRQPSLLAARAASIPLIGDIELFARVAKAPIIAITGTNAKGTVTTLTHNMLHAAGMHVMMGGNIGMPVLDLLEQNTPDYYVLELSSFQLQSTDSLQALAATILNISPDHLDQHTDMEEYINSKQRIYRRAKNRIIHRQDRLTYYIPDILKEPSYEDTSLFWSFGVDEPDDERSFGLRAGQLCWADRTIMSKNDLKVAGLHNISNVLAAMALASACGAPIEALVKGASEFCGLPHRCQWVAEKKGVRWYNDSKGTNVGATQAAIRGLSSLGPMILIAGGDGKKQDFSALQALFETTLSHLIVYGQDAESLAALLPDRTHRVCNLEAAVSMAAKLATSGDTVLLSPACSSLDMFKNYEHRGQVFTECVLAL